MLLPQFALSKTTKGPALAASIGGISELNGSAQIVRDKPLNAEVDLQSKATMKPLPLMAEWL